MVSNRELKDNQEIVYRELPLPEESEEEATRDMALLCENLDLILKRADLIMKRPEYFYLRNSWILVGAIYRGSKNIPLGALLKLWLDGKWTGVCPDCGGKAYIYAAGGSLLSGRHYCHAMCPVCRNTEYSLKGTVLYELLDPAFDLCRRYSQQQKILRTQGPRFSWSKGLVGESVPDKILEDAVKPVSLETLVNKLKKLGQGG